MNRPNIYYKVYQTTKEMLEDRGYQMPPEMENLTLFEFIKLFDEKATDFIAQKKDNAKDKLYVYHHIDTKAFSKKDLSKINEFVKETYPEEDVSILIILQEKATAQINKELNTKEYAHVETFLISELMFNITKHTFVPPHTLLTKEEAEEFLKKHSLTKAQLPRILSTDAVARYYAMKPGQICQIIRKSPSTGESIYYRLVVSAKK